MGTKKTHLDQKSHKADEEGHCLLSQHICPVLATVDRGLNDAISDARRQALLGDLAPALADTLDPSKEHQRSLEWLAWLVRVYLPTWFSLVPALAEHQAALRALPAVTAENAAATEVVVCAAKAAAWAVGDAAWENIEPPAARVAGDVAREATRAAAWEAAWTAAVMDVAQAVAQIVAQTTIVTAVRAAARDAAWAAVRSAVWAAAWAAAWDDDAWDAAAWESCRTAAETRLTSTVEALQDSAVALLRRQCRAAPRSRIGSGGFL